MSDLEKPANVSRLEDSREAQCYLTDTVQILTLRPGVNIKEAVANPAVANTHIWWLSLGSTQGAVFLVCEELCSFWQSLAAGSRAGQPTCPLLFSLQGGRACGFLWWYPLTSVLPAPRQPLNLHNRRHFFLVLRSSRLRDQACGSQRHLCSKGRVLASGAKASSLSLEVPVTQVSFTAYLLAGLV